MRKLSLAFLILLANAAYLAARADATLFYFANVGLHLVLGAVLAVAAAREVRAWRAWPRSLVAAAPLLAAGALFGFALAVVGATRNHEWMLRAHVVAATAGSAIVVAWMVWHVARRAEPGERAATGSGLAILVAVRVAIGVVVVKDRREAPARYRIVNPTLPPQSMQGEGGGPTSPFFPSSISSGTRQR